VGRQLPDKKQIREYLVAQLEHPKEKIRLSALSSLGTLADPQSLAVVETFSKLGTEKPEKAAAEKALEKIRSERTAGPEVAGIRKELLDLQKQNSELRKQMETLQKRMEAISADTPKKP
jgi:HEAT repeat protein